MSQKTLTSLRWGVTLTIVILGIIWCYQGYAFGQYTFMTWIDNTLQYYAWMHRNTAAWHALTPPLWDFSTDSGVSYSGEMQPGAFYPGNILFAWLWGSPTQRALDIFVLIHFAIAWLGMTFFLRAYGLSLTSAIVGGAVFSMIGPIASRSQGQTNIFNGLVYIPWVVGCFKRALDDWPRKRWFSPWLWGTSFFLSLTCLAGHPQPFIHATVLLAFISAAAVISRVYDRRQPECNEDPTKTRTTPFLPLIVLAICVMLTGLGVGIQVLSSHDYFQSSYRWVELDKPISGLATVPWEAYIKHTIDWEHLSSIFFPGSTGGDGGSLFMTHIAIVLAVFGLCSRRRLGWFALGLCVFGLLVALGPETPFGRISYLTPFLNKVREPARALCFYQFGLAMLAALGVAWLESPWPAKWRGRPILAAVFLMAFCIEAGSILKGGFSANDPKAPRQYYQEQGRGPLLDTLISKNAETHGLYRFAAVPREMISPNIGHVYPLSTMLGYRSSFDRDYFDFVSKSWSPESTTWDQMSIRWFVTDKPVSSPKLNLLYQNENVFLYERTGAWPIVHQIAENGKRSPVQMSAINWDINRFSVHVHLDEAARVVFSENTHPGWKAWIDGKRAPIKKKGIFMSLDVPAGDHEIRFSFMPRWFQFGMAGWIVWAITFIVALIWHKLLRQKKGTMNLPVTVSAD
ncbi:MAG TPA: YfhO family protein [Chthoniobacterales bacterium]